MKKIKQMLFYTLIFISSISIFVKLFRQMNRHDNYPFIRSIAKGGVPDQMDNEELAHLENIKMMSEGSQYGVQFFNGVVNEAIEDNEKELQQKIFK